ncbi:MAG TPA: PP0621 family protein [candidate division Zixibacteria bacterium]|nr:PP0621 family protein [candidate division Zixibacteria bacterium]
MFLRLLLFLLLLYVCLRMARAYLRGARDKRGDSLGGKGEEMVLDPQCHAYVPKSEALWRNGNYFCSEECARRFLSG